MKRVSVSLAEVDLRNLDTVAAYEATSRAEVVRRAVYAYFANRNHGIGGLFDADTTHRTMDELMKGFGEDSLAPWQRSNR
ncbi:MAG: hypothetical protein WD557_10755 [Dehalococcoidia bacterium]